MMNMNLRFVRERERKERFFFLVSDIKSKMIFVYMTQFFFLVLKDTRQ